MTACCARAEIPGRGRPLKSRQNELCQKFRSVQDPVRETAGYVSDQGSAMLSSVRFSDVSFELLGRVIKLMSARWGYPKLRF